MNKLHLSYHAHLRRIRRIRRAAHNVQRSKGGIASIIELFEDMARTERIALLAWQQFHRSRRRK